MSPNAKEKDGESHEQLQLMPMTDGGGSNTNNNENNNQTSPATKKKKKRKLRPEGDKAAATKAQQRSAVPGAGRPHCCAVL